jgi:hypothetical protein
MTRTRRQTKKSRTQTQNKENAETENCNTQTQGKENAETENCSTQAQSKENAETENCLIKKVVSLDEIELGMKERKRETGREKKHC